MKHLLVTALTVFSAQVASAQPCGEININGQDLAPMLLTSGQATLMNDSDGTLITIACEKFDGVLEGVGRIQRLDLGACTFVSGKNGNVLIGCAE